MRLVRQSGRCVEHIARNVTERVVLGRRSVVDVVAPLAPVRKAETVGIQIVALRHLFVQRSRLLVIILMIVLAAQCAMVDEASPHRRQLLLFVRH